MRIVLWAWLVLMLGSVCLADEVVKHDPSGLSFPAAVGSSQRLFARSSLLRSDGLEVGYRDS
ncbi:MAG: hypothetical protein KC910_26685, partial [Candidatus Eremiobacteraeota bacterium]|nr:hypothetical protein [Candidatus Eremiobacteraeota bacterium]